MKRRTFLKGVGLMSLFPVIPRPFITMQPKRYVTPKDIAHIALIRLYHHLKFKRDNIYLINDGIIKGNKTNFSKSNTSNVVIDKMSWVFFNLCHDDKRLRIDRFPKFIDPFVKKMASSIDRNLKGKKYMFSLPLELPENSLSARATQRISMRSIISNETNYYGIRIDTLYGVA